MQKTSSNVPSNPDEQWYLNTYPDVARAIMEGRFDSGFEHYAQHGEKEGRRAPPGGNWQKRRAVRNSSVGAGRAILDAMAEARLPKGGGIRPCAPRTPRELIGAFAGYDESRGLSSVLDRIDRHTTDPAQIYWAVLSRWPDIAEIRESSNRSSRELFEALIKGAEFQSNIVNYVLTAYPEKRRFLFVHVPKCAGSDLAAVLSKVLPSIHQTLSIDAWASADRLFSALRELALDLERADGVFVQGHHTLQWFMANNLNRPTDRLFTIIRDPWDRLLSQVNYIVTRIHTDSEATGTDTRQWLSQLELTAPVTLDLNVLALRVLRHPTLISKDGICSCFGSGSCGEAIANFSQSDIEITDITRYKEWLLQTWGIRSATKVNQSQPILKRGDLSKEDEERIERLIFEDNKLFAVVQSKLRDAGQAFVRGIDFG